MSGDLDAIKRIVEAFERSDWQEIDVRSGHLRVHLASSPDSTPNTASVPPTDAGAASAAPALTTVEVDPVDDAAAAQVSIPDGALVVTAPSPGIFWRAPEPGAPPFTEVGRVIEPGSTLCIIEVMKLMSHLKADVGGRVVGIYAENGTAVAKDEPLFAITTAGSAP